MAFNIERMRKNLRNLRKDLKKNKKRLTPDEVHKLRTHARRFEAGQEAVSLLPKKDEKQTLRAVKRIRRRAGRVRDMDVLTGHLSSVKVEGEPDCLVQLFEYLGSQRYENARKLRRIIRRHSVDLRQSLKKNAARLEKKRRNKFGSDDPAKAAALALRLSSELAEPATLTPTNLHPYRQKVKKLLCILQMGEGAEQQEFIDALGECKDAIGEWHDWEQLIAIASDILEQGSGRKLLSQLREISKRKLEAALTAANRLRKGHVRMAKAANRSAPGRGEPKQPALKAVSSIAA
jgi:CHAD domain-containing protein